MKNIKNLILILIALSLASCAMPKRGDIEFAPAMPVQQTGPVQHTDSIYQLGSAWLLHEDMKPRRIGDMLTVTLQEKTAAKKSSDTSTNKATTGTISATSLLGAPVTSSGRELLETDIASAYDFKGASGSGQSNSLTGSVTVVVVAVQANGNLMVQGEKWININQGEEYIRLRGIVRPSDIGPDNTISSERIANAEIQYSGDGTLGNANKQGWLTKILNSPWMPF
jgi:flagellar L-ring protein precursor FlgH